MRFLDNLKMSTPELMAQLCRDFYTLGWVSGTGGGISIRDHHGIYLAPSGVQKERICADDIFLCADDLLEPASAPRVLRPAKNPALRISECAPLFYNAYRLRKAGACIHSHSIWAVLATRLAAKQGSPHLFSSHGLEMQKGLRGKGCMETIQIPIIANTARESALSDSMQAAMIEHPDVDAVLVANHGLYVWGKDWIEAKTQAECLDYLCRAAVESHRLGV